MTSFPILNPGSLAFADSSTNLEDGSYTITARLDLSNINISDAPTQINVTQNFSILGGPRFSIPSTYISTIYPPNGAIRIPSTNLSQIVITDPQLPWVRDFNYSDSSSSRPWMALFALNPQELTIDPSNIPSGLTSGPNGSYRMPTSTIQSWNQNSGNYPNVTIPSYNWNDEQVPVGSESNCNMIFIPKKLFNALIPTVDSPKYFSHCRSVNSGANIVSGLTSSGAFSVLVSNRFISSGPVVMHLVSLENVGPFAGAVTTDYAGLVSLYTWSYTTADLTASPKDDFDTLFSQLIKNSAPLRIEQKINNASNYPINAMASLIKISNDRISDGFCPIRYHASTGTDTLAWSRGAFTPGKVDYIPNFISNDTNNGSLDGSGLKIYDSISGTFDLTYTLAWQLGRNLLISNKKIYQHLMQFKRTIYQLNLQYSKNQLTVSNTVDNVIFVNQLLSAKESLYSQLLEVLQKITYMTKSNINQSATNSKYFTSTFLTTNNRDYDSSIPNAYYTSYTSLSNTLKNDDLDQVITWIQQIIRLSGIPFHYLVQNPQAIPMESTRFFYVDPNWLDAIVDGAVSVIGNLVADLDIRNLIRKIILYQNQSKPMWGLFIRSTIVSTYPGLIINLGDDPTIINNNMLPIIRLNPTLLMCLFTNAYDQNDLNNRLLIGEGPEQFRFGFDNQLNLRDPDNGSLLQNVFVSRSSIVDPTYNTINGTVLESTIRSTLGIDSSFQPLYVRRVAIQLIQPPNYKLLYYGIPRTWEIASSSYDEGQETYVTTNIIYAKKYDFQAIDIIYNPYVQMFVLGSPSIIISNIVSGSTTSQAHTPAISSIATIFSYKLYETNYTPDSDIIPPAFSFLIGYGYLIHTFSYNSKNASLKWLLTPTVYSFKVDLMTDLPNNIGVNVIPFTKVDFLSQLQNLDFDNLSSLSLGFLMGSYSMASTPNWGGIYVLTAYDAQGNSEKSQIIQPVTISSIPEYIASTSIFRLIGPASPIYNAYSIDIYLITYNDSTWDVAPSSLSYPRNVTTWAFDQHTIPLDQNPLSIAVITNLYNNISEQSLLGNQLNIIEPGVSPCSNSNSPILNFGEYNNTLKWACYPTGSRYNLYQVNPGQPNLLLKSGNCSITLSSNGDCICSLSGTYLGFYNQNLIYMFELIDKDGYSYTSVYPSLSLGSTAFPNGYTPSPSVDFSLSVSPLAYFNSSGNCTVVNFDNEENLISSQDLTYTVSNGTLSFSFDLDTIAKGTYISIQDNIGLINQVYDFGLDILSFTVSDTNNNLLIWVLSSTALSYVLSDAQALILSSGSTLLRAKNTANLDIDNSGLTGSYLIGSVNPAYPPYTLTVYGPNDGKISQICTPPS